MLHIYQLCKPPFVSLNICQIIINNSIEKYVKILYGKVSLTFFFMKKWLHVSISILSSLVSLLIYYQELKMLPLKLVASDLYILKNMMKCPEASVLQSI